MCGGQGNRNHHFNLSGHRGACNVPRERRNRHHMKSLGVGCARCDAAAGVAFGCCICNVVLRTFFIKCSILTPLWSLFTCSLPLP